MDDSIPVRKVARVKKEEQKRKRPSGKRFVDDGANMIIGAAKHEEKIEAEEQKQDSGAARPFLIDKKEEKGWFWLEWRERN